MTTNTLLKRKLLFIFIAFIPNRNAPAFSPFEGSIGRKIILLMCIIRCILTFINLLYKNTINSVIQSVCLEDYWCDGFINTNSLCYVFYRKWSWKPNTSSFFSLKSIYCVCRSNDLHIPFLSPPILLLSWGDLPNHVYENVDIQFWRLWGDYPQSHWKSKCPYIQLTNVIC